MFKTIDDAFLSSRNIKMTILAHLLNVWSYLDDKDTLACNMSRFFVLF